MESSWLDRWSPWRLRKRLESLRNDLYVAECAYQRTIPKLLQKGVQFHCSDSMTVRVMDRPEQVAVMMGAESSYFESESHIKELHKEVVAAAYLVKDQNLSSQIKVKLAEDISDFIARKWLGIEIDYEE